MVKIKYEKFTITLPKKLLEKFREFCQNNSINMSGKIAKLIEKDLNSTQKE